MHAVPVRARVHLFGLDALEIVSPNPPTIHGKLEIRITDAK